MSRPAYSFATLEAYIGVRFGPSPTVVIDQTRINAFATTTDDPQWIHVDPARAAKTPFGGTIAHGYLTLALLAGAFNDLGMIPPDAAVSINYGLNKVRFLAPVPVNSRVSSHFTLARVEPRGANAKLLHFEAVTSIEGIEKPALIAETLILFEGRGPDREVAREAP